MSKPKFVITNNSNFKLNILDAFFLAPTRTVDVFAQNLPYKEDAMTVRIVEDLIYGGPFRTYINSGEIIVLEYSSEFTAAIMGAPSDPSGVTPESIGAERVGVASGLMGVHSSAPNPHPQYAASTEIDTKITAHINAADPHAQYTTDSEVQAMVTGGFIAHNSQLDPHTQYTTDAEATVIAASAIFAHTGESNPHSQYARLTDIDSKISTHTAQIDPHPQYTTDTEVTTFVNSGISTHSAAANPHSQYLQGTDVDNKIAAHVALPDPHSQYTTDSEVNSFISTAISNHVGAGNPHSQYAQTSAVSTSISNAIQAHKDETTPHSQYTTAAQAAAAAPVQSVAGRTGAVTLSVTDVTNAVSTSNPALTNARTPLSHAASHQHGGSDEIATSTAAANAIPKAGSDGKIAATWLPAPNNTLTSSSTTESLSAAQGKNLQDTKQKNITSGTAAPTGGVNGDIYLQYT